jgi:hypothetical protein
MKKTSLVLLVVWIASLMMISSNASLYAEESEGINLGKVYIPKDFIHAQKDYQKGTYRMKLINKEGTPYFQVYDKNNQLLFEEMAVIKPNTGKAKNFKYRIHKELLRGYEYYRVKVTKPDQLEMAYFLLK